MRDLIEEIQDFYNWLVKFITVDIWNLNIDDFGKAKRKMIKYAKVAIVTIKEVGKKHLGLYAFSLSFFSAMSMVPFIAITFAVTDGFGLKMHLRNMILDSFDGNREIVETVMGFAENIISTSQGGTFGIVSYCFFIGTILWLILNVEKCFNMIWKVERARSIARRFLYYVGILVIAPFVVLIFMSMTFVFNHAVSDISSGMPALASLGPAVQWLAFYGIIALSLTIMYKYIPNVKVKFSAAFYAAAIAGFAFVAMQYIYMGTQLFVSRMSAVYGAFAAIPLFLIWMNISWSIVLFGAEVSHAYQYVNNYTSDNDTQLSEEVKNKLQL